MFKAFSWAKNTARGVRFLLRFNMYLFLAQCEQVPGMPVFATCHKTNMLMTKYSWQRNETLIL